MHDRRPAKGMGLVHHSDRGSQYLSIRYSERLAEAGIEPSVGSVGDSYDNALAETINGLFKAEVIYRRGPLPLSRLLPLMIFTFLVISAYGILKQVAALRLHDAMGYPLELASARAGAAMAATAAALIAVQLFLLRHLRRPAEAIMALGAWSGVLGMALCAFAPGFAGLLAGAVLFGIAMGLMLPGTLASLSFRAGCDQQGKAAGLNVMGQGLGLTLGPLLGAAMHRISPHLPLVAAFGLMLVAAGLAQGVRRRRLHL